MKYEFEIFWKQKSKLGADVDCSFRTTADAVKLHLSALLKKNVTGNRGCRKL
jgi:hypothetical protein